MFEYVGGSIVGGILALLFIYGAAKVATTGILHARRDFARRSNNKE